MDSTFQMVTFYILSELFLTFWLGKSVCFVSWCKSSKHPLIRKRRKYELWMRVNASVYLLIILLLLMFVLLLSCQLLLIVFFLICKMFLFVRIFCLKPMSHIIWIVFLRMKQKFKISKLKKDAIIHDEMHYSKLIKNAETCNNSTLGD